MTLYLSKEGATTGQRFRRHQEEMDAPSLDIFQNGLTFFGPLHRVKTRA